MRQKRNLTQIKTSEISALISPTHKESPLIKKTAELKDFIFPFLVPTLIGKSLVLYFGLNYSEYPGEGYGYGLIITIAFTLTMMARFLWRFRDTEDVE